MQSSENAQTCPLQPEQQAGLNAAGQSFLRHLLAGEVGPFSATDNLRAADSPRPLEFVRGVDGLPTIGDWFGDFELIQELGRGAFARVYLARQANMAGRLVALKVSTDPRGEAQVLARLQHTNIVPVYSAHRDGALHGVCMPYFGDVTLARLLNHVQGQPALPSSGRSLVQTLRARKPQMGHQPPASGSTAPAKPLPTAAALDMLERLSYVDAVLWLTARLADGLAHAHEHGILHCDLKPANVLVADDGQPMLLDFNVSVEFSNQMETCKAAVGGTFPYMAPEQLRLVQAGCGQIDCRADIYSLGVILFEMLTCRHPFSAEHARFDVLPAMVAARESPPRARDWNRAISPAVDSIVARCLAPNSSQRYQSAAQLREDIERHRNDLPLKYAPNPSVLERACKWKRRHPRLTSATSLVAGAAVVIAALLVLLAIRGQRLGKLEAIQVWEEFENEGRLAQVGIYARVGDPKELAQGLEDCGRALARYQVLENDDWLGLPSVVNLPDDNRHQLSQHVADLLVLRARGLVQQIAPEAPQAARQATLLEGLDLNERAAACFDEGDVPRAVWQQKARLSKLLGRDEEARGFQEKADQIPLRSAQEYYWSGADKFLAGQPREAVPLLEEALRRDPKQLRAWFVLGRCHEAEGREPECIGCYNACIALAPEFPWAYFNRGLAHLQLGKHAAAIADFSRVLLLRPNSSDACINRALAHQGLNQNAEAAADLTHALELGAAQTRIYFMRARVWDKCGDQDKAKADRYRGLELEPTDEKSWIARGLARLPADPKGALGDFDRALALNPQSTDALQNQAHVLTEHLPAATAADKVRHTETAIAALDKALKIRPDYVPARSGRGVLLARLGKRDLAIADGKAVLCRDTSGRTLYEVACVYALTAKQNPEDALEALRLLSAALRQGFGHDYIETDDDLIALRPNPEYRRLAEAARALKGK